MIRKAFAWAAVAAFAFATAARADDAADVRKELAEQVELFKKADAEALKKRFTERLRDKITEKALKDVQKEVGAMKLEELADSVAVEESGGKKFAKVKMKSGRTLTTFVKVEGKWLADTLWIK